MRGHPPLLALLGIVAFVGGCASGDDPDARSGTDEHADATVVVPTLPPPIKADAPSTPLSKLETARLEFDSPDWMTVLDDSLWVRLDTGEVVNVNPRTARVESHARPTGDSPRRACQGFGSSPGAIWSCSPFGQLQRIDSSNGKTADNLDIDMSTGQGHFVFAGSLLWVLAPDGQSMKGIDPETNEQRESVPLGVACIDLAADGSDVWAVCPWDNQVIRIDTQSLAVVARLEVAKPEQAMVGDDLWVIGREGIYQIDREELAVLAVYDIEAGYGGGIGVTDDSVWVRSPEGPFLTGIDTKRQQVFAVIEERQLPSSGNVVVVDDQIWATANDDATLVRLKQPAGAP